MATTIQQVLYIRLWREIGPGWQNDPEAIGGWGVSEIAGPITGLAGGWRHWVDCANLLGNSGWELFHHEEDGTPGYPATECNLVLKRRVSSRE